MASKKVGNLLISEGNDQYIQRIVGLLNQIQSRAAGRAILNHAKNGKIGIVPDNSGERCNASTHSIPIVQGMARIEYSPGLQKSCKSIWWSDDESLLHEIVHGVLVSHGITNLSTRDDEFYAVLFANIYRSEKGVNPQGEKWKQNPIDLRRNHGDEKMRGAEAAGFMNNLRHVRLIDNLGCSPQMNPLWWAIAKIETFFNPIREWATSPKYRLTDMKKMARI